MAAEPKPTHHVALAILQGSSFVGVTTVGFNVNPEPTCLDDVDKLGERITAAAHREGDLSLPLHYTVLSWQPFIRAKRWPWSS